MREILAAKDGDHSDGGGLLLRVRGDSASWVLRYTASTIRRREMAWARPTATTQRRPATA